MKTTLIILTLATLTGCATSTQKATDSTPAPAAKPAAPLAEASPAVTIPAVAIAEPPLVQIPTASQPATQPLTTTNGWDDLSRIVANWSGTVHKAMASNCPQEVTAKP